jgi:hypothetical protein
MTEGDGAVAHPVFDVLPAIGVPDPASEAARDETGREDRILIIALGVGVAPAGNQVVRDVLEARRELPAVNWKSLELMTVRAHSPLPQSLSAPGTAAFSSRSFGI